MRLLIKLIFIFLPLISYSSVAELIVKGKKQEIVLDQSVYFHLFPDSLPMDSVRMSKFSDYGRKLMSAIDAGLDTLPDYNEFNGLLKNDMLVSDWTEYNTMKRFAEIDPDGYFKTNITRYKWNAPRFKGTILLGESDSILSLAADYFKSDSVQAISDLGLFQTKLRQRFGTKVRLITVLTEKGRNPFVDKAVFDEDDNIVTGNKWKGAVKLTGNIISEPESWLDVKDIVVDDIRNEILKTWSDSLRAIYPVEIIFNHN